MDYELFLNKETDLFDVNVYVGKSELDNESYLLRIDVLSKHSQNNIIYISFDPIKQYTTSRFPLYRIFEIDNGRCMTNILCAHKFKNLFLFENFYLDNPIQIKIRYKVGEENTEEYIEIITLEK